MATETPGPDPAEVGPLSTQSDERTARADWRSTIVGSIGITLLIGLWLIASVVPLEYERPLLAVIWGVAIVVLGLLRLLGPTRSRTLALLQAAAGVLTALTAIVADGSAGEAVNLALMGAATTVLALIGLGAHAEGLRTSRP